MKRFCHLKVHGTAATNQKHMHYADIMIDQVLIHCICIMYHFYNMYLCN